MILICTVYTVEPLYKGHFGTLILVLITEVSSIQRSFDTLQYYTGRQNGVLIIEVSTFQRFAIERSHCTYRSGTFRTFLTQVDFVLWLKSMGHGSLIAVLQELGYLLVTWRRLWMSTACGALCGERHLMFTLLEPTMLMVFM